jgi:ASC-1-like (ASCH) protein
MGRMTGYWVLNLFPDAYEAIDKYGKSVEGRAPDPFKPEKDYKRMKVGDKIVFRAISREDFRPLDLEDIVFRVKFNHHYFGGDARESVRMMLEGEGLEELLPGFSSIEEGIELYLGLPGYDERIERHGIYAIGLGKRVFGYKKDKVRK